MGLPPSLAKRSWLSVSEVAAILSVSIWTISRWCREKKLPAAKCGKSWRINIRKLKDKHETFLSKQLIEMAIREMDQQML